MHVMACLSFTILAFLSEARRLHVVLWLATAWLATTLEKCKTIADGRQNELFRAVQVVGTTPRGRVPYQLWYLSRLRYVVVPWRGDN